MRTVIMSFVRGMECGEQTLPTNDLFVYLPVQILPDLVTAMEQQGFKPAEVKGGSGYRPKEEEVAEPCIELDHILWNDTSPPCGGSADHRGKPRHTKLWPPVPQRTPTQHVQRHEGRSGQRDVVAFRRPVKGISAPLTLSFCRESDSQNVALF